MGPYFYFMIESKATKEAMEKLRSNPNKKMIEINIRVMIALCVISGPFILPIVAIIACSDKTVSLRSILVSYKFDQFNAVWDLVFQLIGIIISFATATSSSAATGAILYLIIGIILWIKSILTLMSKNRSFVLKEFPFQLMQSFMIPLSWIFCCYPLKFLYEVDEKQAAKMLPKDLLDYIRENKICPIPDLTPENSDADNDPEKEYMQTEESVESTDP